MWALIGLYSGREDNTFCRREPHGLAITGAIHVYGGDLLGTPPSKWEPGTLQERPFDVARAKQVFVEASERWHAEQEAAPR
jgi:predicted metal-dependent enzyme (double-stranded beta helix superfamily)